MAGTVARALRHRLGRGQQVVTTDAAPPAAPAGWRTGPPDFVGIGVQRAGTTWWFDELRGHPGFVQAPHARKELHFFDGFAGRTFTAADADRYHRWFPRPPGCVTGEWTPAYIFLPWAIPMLVRAAPDARVLLVLRDPVERFRSGFLLQTKRGLSSSEATLDAFHRGLYAGQVAELLTHVPRAQVLVLLYEEGREAPDAARRRLAEFVGLDPDRFDAPVRRRSSSTISDAVPDGMATLLATVGRRYTADVRRLSELLPELDFGRWSITSA